MRTRHRSILPHSDHSGSTESKSETFGAHHAAVYSLSDWYKISGRSMTADLDPYFPVKPFQKIEQLVRREAAEMPVRQV